jgi:hypothetical protein
VSVSQAVPTEESPGGDIARRLAAALGTAWQAGDTTHNAALLLAIGDAFADLYADQDIATNQAFVNTATVMLSELEERYGLTVRIDMSTADRQTRLLSKVRAARAGTPQGIERSITPYDPTVTVAENLSSDPLLGDPRGVYVFAVQIAASVFSDPTKLAAIRDAVEQLKVAYTLGNVCTRTGFRCDDPLSLTDRDVL